MWEMFCQRLALNLTGFGNYILPGLTLKKNGNDFNLYQDVFLLIYI